MAALAPVCMFVEPKTKQATKNRIGNNKEDSTSISVCVRLYHIFGFIYSLDGFANDCRDDNIDYLLIRALACFIVFILCHNIRALIISDMVWHMKQKHKNVREKKIVRNVYTNSICPDKQHNDFVYK